MTRPSTETSIGGLPCRAALASRLTRTRSSRRGSVVTSDSCTTRTSTSGVLRRHPPGDELAEHDVLQLGPLGGPVEPGHLQDVLDERAHRLRPVPDQLGGAARRQQFRGREQAGHRRAQLVGDVGGDPALGLDAAAAARRPWRPRPAPARRSRRVRHRRWRPAPVRRDSPLATWCAAAAALRSRRDSWPPMSTPSARAAEDDRDRADDQGLVEVLHDVRAAVGEAGVQGEHAAVLAAARPPRCRARRARRRRRTWPAGPAATFASRSFGMARVVELDPEGAAARPARTCAGRPGCARRPGRAALSSIDTRAALCTTRLSATATSAPTSAIAALSFHRRPVRMPRRPAPDGGQAPARAPAFHAPRPAQALSL